MGLPYFQTNHVHSVFTNGPKCLWLAAVTFDREAFPVERPWQHLTATSHCFSRSEGIAAIAHLMNELYNRFYMIHYDSTIDSIHGRVPSSTIFYCTLMFSNFIDRTTVIAPCWGEVWGPHVRHGINIPWSKPDVSHCFWTCWSLVFVDSAQSNLRVWTKADRERREERERKVRTRKRKQRLCCQKRKGKEKEEEPK